MLDACCVLIWQINQKTINGCRGFGEQDLLSMKVHHALSEGLEATKAGSSAVVATAPASHALKFLCTELSELVGGKRVTMSFGDRHNFFG